MNTRPGEVILLRRGASGLISARRIGGVVRLSVQAAPRLGYLRKLRSDGGFDFLERRVAIAVHQHCPRKLASILRVKWQTPGFHKRDQRGYAALNLPLGGLAHQLTFSLLTQPGVLLRWRARGDIYGYWPSRRCLARMSVITTGR